MKKNKTEKGITLVALIITIIVLLILAVVAIGIVRGDGILFHAKDASTKYAEKAEEENSTLQGYAEMIEEQAGSVAFTTEDGVPIPKGFKYIEGTKEDGVVIEREGADKSQFVWVPITEDIQEHGLGTADYREPDVITGVSPSSTVDSASGKGWDAVKENLDAAGCTEDLNGDKVVNAYDFKIQLTNEFNAMKKSVNHYRGFYVGRYETSRDANGRAQSIYGAISAYSSTSENNWYGLYKIQKGYSTESVQGSMIWGSQWNAMITWMGDAANTTITGKNGKRTTGTCETDVIKKVYDLYGNSTEWTLEAWSTYFRDSRGGDYFSSFFPSEHDRKNPTTIEGDFASRLALYIR